MELLVSLHYKNPVVYKSATFGADEFLAQTDLKSRLTQKPDISTDFNRKLADGKINELPKGSYADVYHDTTSSRVYKFQNYAVKHNHATVLPAIVIKKNEQNQSRIMKEATDPARLCRYWNEIYTTLGLERYATARLVKLKLPENNRQVGLEMPFIDGKNYDPANPEHKKLVANLQKKLHQAGMLLQHTETKGNIKIITVAGAKIDKPIGPNGSMKTINYPSKQIAVPVDIDFISSSRSTSFISNSLNAGVY